MGFLCAWWWRLSTHGLLVLGSGGMLLHPRKRGLLGRPKSDRNATRSGRQVSSLYPSRSNWMPLTLSCGTYSSPPQYLLIPIPNRVHSLGPAALLASYVPCQTLDLFPLRQMHNSDQAEVGVVYHTIHVFLPKGEAERANVLKFLILKACVALRRDRSKTPWHEKPTKKHLESRFHVWNWKK